VQLPSGRVIFREIPLKFIIWIKPKDAHFHIPPSCFDAWKVGYACVEPPNAKEYALLALVCVQAWHIEFSHPHLTLKSGRRGEDSTS